MTQLSLRLSASEARRDTKEPTIWLSDRILSASVAIALCGATGLMLATITGGLLA